MKTLLTLLFTLLLSHNAYAFNALIAGAGQPVAGDEYLGPDICSGWTATTGTPTIVGNAVTWTYGEEQWVQCDDPWKEGTEYKISVTVTGHTGSYGRDPHDGPVNTQLLANGTFVSYYTPSNGGGDNAEIYMYGALNYEATVTVNYIKEVFDSQQYGPELFVADLTDGTGASVTGEDGTHIVTFSGAGMRYQSGTTSPVLIVTFPGTYIADGTTYLVEMEGTVTSGYVKFDYFTTANYLPFDDGTFSEERTGDTGYNLQIVRGTTDVDITITSISVREVL